MGLLADVPIILKSSYFLYLINSSFLYNIKYFLNKTNTFAEKSYCIFFLETISINRYFKLDNQKLLTNKTACPTKMCIKFAPYLHTKKG